jgi:hypothetical protein
MGLINAINNLGDAKGSIASLIPTIIAVGIAGALIYASMKGGGQGMPGVAFFALFFILLAAYITVNNLKN